MGKLIFLISIFLFTAFYQLKAEEKPIDPVVRQALMQTKMMLSNPQAREQEANKTEEGRQAHENAMKVAGNAANLQVMYMIAGEIMSQMVMETGGDAEKLQSIIQNAEKDPEAFYKSLSPELQKQISNLAKQVPTN